MKAVIQTYSGLELDILNPHPDQISIIDIAHGLSNLCRYTGQTRFFYSVAQHSVLTATYLEKKYGPREAFAGLLHDASEAYMGDVSTPLKNLLPEYKSLEHRLQMTIAEKFKVGHHPSEVAEADSKMFMMEAPYLLPKANWDFLKTDDDDDFKWAVEIPKWDIYYTPPLEAYKQFLAYFTDLEKNE